MTTLQFRKEFWVNIKPRLHSVLPKKQHCPTCCNRLNTLKPTLANTIPTMLGDVAPTCCVRLHGALQRIADNIPFTYHHFKYHRMLRQALPILELNVTAPGANLTKYLLTVPPPCQNQNRCPPSLPLPTRGSFGAKYIPKSNHVRSNENHLKKILI